MICRSYLALYSYRSLWKKHPNTFWKIASQYCFQHPMLFWTFLLQTKHDKLSNFISKCRLNTLKMTILYVNIRACQFIFRWSHGLLFHQAMVDCARAAILMPLGTSILYCRPVNKCSLVETAFLLLVTVSTVNLLTTVLNDAPVLPDDDDDDAIPMLMDSPQCVVFGMFMIW